MASAYTLMFLEAIVVIGFIPKCEKKDMHIRRGLHVVVRSETILKGC